jgi:hypothetical protein
MHATGFALARFLTPILLVLIGFGLVASLAQNVEDDETDRGDFKDGFQELDLAGAAEDPAPARGRGSTRASFPS